ncbi:MAG: glycine/betaine/sarcosine/D-proline family reductase selenoprotein B [Chloroflexi bacterium]|nr:glycine/betaine/sarcosine/D-proline family reductase selenoprotein B [Chloroflexota bacterium]
MKVVHFINHFFAGIGGEERADTPVGVREGPAGPGNLLQSLLPAGATVVATVFSGDNYFNENLETAGSQVLEIVRQKQPDVLIAGPAFDNGRYGVACAEICHRAASALGITAITAMYEENPGVDVYRGYKNLNTFLFPCSETASGMKEAVARMAAFAARTGQVIGPASEEGYVARGIRKIVRVDKPGWERAIDMLLAKINGNPYVTEVPLRTLEVVTPAPPVADLSQANIALVNTAGIMPFGNPDAFKRRRNNQWRKYPIAAEMALKQGEWEAIHSGYNTMFVNENPNRGMPVDGLRAAEKERLIGRLNDYFYVTPGVQASVNTMKQIGQEMAQQMKAEGVQAAVMVST